MSGTANANDTPPDRRQNPAAAMVLNGGVDEQEYISIPAPEGGIIIEDAPDGGAFVSMPGQRIESEPPDEGFYSNLAVVIPAAELSRIAADLLRKVEEDKEARKKRDEQYEEGVRRTGLGKDAPGGADFEGASRVVHPMLTEACIDYESRIIKELFPSNGHPVKPRVLGAPTKEKTDRAQRVTDHMSWQLRRQIKEARATLEVVLTQTPLGGSQFIRQTWDHRLKRPKWDFVPIDKVYLPYNASDFYSAHRKTYSETISETELRLRVSSGQYVDLGLGPTGMMPEETRTEKASRKVEGAEDPGFNIDGAREILEVQVLLEVTEGVAEALGLEQAGELYPYLVSIDSSSRRVLAMYRAWEDGDDAREAIDHLFEFPFLPWRGAFSVGFPHVIGGLSAAATGAMRALLDSALINNSAGGLILRGAGSSGSTPRPVIGELTEIDAGQEADDIRKRVMPFPSNQPSGVLFQLLGFVVTAAQGVVRTSLDDSPTQGATPVPVGTQMSRVEEGLVVFTAVAGRAHAAFGRLLAGLHRLNRLYLPEFLKVDAEGEEILVRRSDYAGPCVVQPVSEPTVYSDQQRFAQLNYLHTRAQAAPNLWNLRAVELAGLKLIKWPDPESLLATPPEARELNAASENVAMALGRPTAVFPAQDHMAHLKVLIDFVQSPVLGTNPLIAPAYLPRALKHAAEHVIYLYEQSIMASIKEANDGDPVTELLSDDEAVKSAFDGLVATASGPVVAQLGQMLSPAAPVLQRAMAALQQLMPKPPPDPALAAVQAASAETARKTADDNATAQIAALKIAAGLEGDRIGAGSRIVAAEITANAQMDARAVTESGMDGPSDEETEANQAAAPPNQAPAPTGPVGKPWSPAPPEAQSQPNEEPPPWPQRTPQPT